MKKWVKQEVKMIDINRIKSQDRLNTLLFPIDNGEKIDELIKSIKNCGLDRPLDVTPDLRLLAGHHRLAGCREAGMKQVPCIIHRLQGKEEEIAFMVRENYVRRQFSPKAKVEVIKNYARAVKRPITASELHKTFGIPVSSANRLLLTLEAGGFKALKRKRKSVPPRVRRLDRIKKRHQSTINELYIFPLSVVTQARKMAELYVVRLKTIEKSKRKEKIK